MNKGRGDIIEKIQKLLALANSSNEHEAKAAAQRAQSLLVKYNLTMSEIDLEEGEEKYTSELFETGSTRSSQEWKYIHSILTQFFFVRIIHSKKPVAMVSANGPLKVRHEIVFSMVGQSHNVAVAKYVKDFLTRSFKDLFAQYRKATGAAATSKESFYLGLYNGLKTQLKDTQTQVEQETGLAVVPDADLDQFLQDLFKNTIKSKAVAINNIHDKAAVQAGVEQGKNLRIARGLSGSSEGQKKIGHEPKLGEV